MKKLFRDIVLLLSIFSVIVIMYVVSPNFAKIVNNVNEQIDSSFSLISRSVGNFDFDSIGKFNDFVSDAFFSDNKGFTGEDYEFDEEFYPYYGMLSEKNKKIYKQVYANALNLNESFVPIDNVKVDEVTDILASVIYDHPELFWLDSASYEYSKNKCLKINLVFNETIEDIENNKKLFEDNVLAIVEDANKYYSDYAKEKYVHDLLISSIDYDESASLNQTAYSAIVNRVTVCAGYSKAYSYILTKLGIPCYFVVGDSDGNHAWNMVKINGNYYNVDLTWDDDNNNLYKYFNKSDLDFETHTRTGLSINLPVCNANSYHLVKRNYKNNYAILN